MADGGAPPAPPPNRIQFFRFHIHFCQKAPTSEVSAPPPPQWEILDLPLVCLQLLTFDTDKSGFNQNAWAVLVLLIFPSLLTAICPSLLTDKGYPIVYLHFGVLSFTLGYILNSLPIDNSC